MLTARSQELEKTRGLRAGADDYVTKPFGRQELIARIDALLRRSGGRDAAATEDYSDAFVSIDFAQREVTAAGRSVELTPLEFRLLTAFVRHPNQVLSQDQLLELVWGGRRVARAGEALCGLLAQEAVARSARRSADRDEARLRVHLPAQASGQVANRSRAANGVVAPRAGTRSWRAVLAG